MEMLVEMKAKADADREERKADQEKMDADRKVDREQIKLLINDGGRYGEHSARSRDDAFLCLCASVI
jgi:hypothetical protein